MSALLPSTKPLTIAFFVEGMYASGVDTSTRLLAEALRAQGHRVVTFLPWKERCISGNQDLVLLPSIRVNEGDQVVCGECRFELFPKLSDTTPSKSNAV